MIDNQWLAEQRRIAEQYHRESVAASSRRTTKTAYWAGVIDALKLMQRRQGKEDDL